MQCQVHNWRNDINQQLGEWLIPELANVVSLYVATKVRILQPSYVEEFMLVFGLKEGRSTFRSNHRELREFHCRGERHGTRYEYDKRGNLIRQCEYDHDKSHGKEETWFNTPPNHKSRQCFWFNNLQHGVDQRWNSRGKLISKRTWINGQIYGQPQEWSETGVPKHGVHGFRFDHVVGQVWKNGFLQSDDRYSCDHYCMVRDVYRPNQVMETIVNPE